MLFGPGIEERLENHQDSVAQIRRSPMKAAEYSSVRQVTSRENPLHSLRIEQLEQQIRESQTTISNLRSDIAELHTNDAYIERLEKEKEFLEQELKRNRETLRAYEARMDALEGKLQTALAEHTTKVEASSFRLDQTNEFTFAFDEPVGEGNLLEDSLNPDPALKQDIILKVSKRDLDRIMELTKRNKELERLNKSHQFKIKELEDEQLKFDARMYDKDRKLTASEREKLILFQKLQEVEEEYQKYIEMAKHQFEALRNSQRAASSPTNQGKQEVSTYHREVHVVSNETADVTFSEEQLNTSAVDIENVR